MIVMSLLPMADTGLPLSVSIPTAMRSTPRLRYNTLIDEGVTRILNTNVALAPGLRVPTSHTILGGGRVNIEPWLGTPILTKLTFEEIVSFNMMLETSLPPMLVTIIVSS
jgi:hypothetical protein